MRPKLQLAALVAATALIGGGNSAPGTSGMGGGPMSPEEKQKRTAERQSRREFKTARAEAKRQRKAERRLSGRSEKGESQ